MAHLSIIFNIVMSIVISYSNVTIFCRDCIQGLGVRKLKEAYDILDEFEADELEVRQRVLSEHNMTQKSLSCCFISLFNFYINIF